MDKMMNKFNALYINKMWTRSKQAFMMDSSSNQMPLLPSSYIFDDTYKTKQQKNKFQRNPKFAYFNTVIKIKNKLSEQHHDIYEMMFDPQCTQQQGKWKNINLALKSKINATTSTKDRHHASLYSTDLKEHSDRSNSNRNSVKQIHFQSSNRHIRKRSQIYYDSKPRLDDILAQYRKMNKRQSLSKQKNNSFSLGTNKKIVEEFKSFNRTGRLLPRQFSQPHRNKKTPMF